MIHKYYFPLKFSAKKSHSKIVKQIIKNFWPVLLEIKYTGLFWSVCVTKGRKKSTRRHEAKKRPGIAAILRLFVHFQKNTDQ